MESSRGSSRSTLVVDYCREHALQFTRLRPYRKNDQAWVAQKNGAVVRRLVGYGRLQGREATVALARLYAVARLYVNFFQPSFKLTAKIREEAHVIKRYAMPATPCERLLGVGLPQCRERGEIAASILDPRPGGIAARDPHDAGGAGGLCRHRLCGEPVTHRRARYRHLCARLGDRVEDRRNATHTSRKAAAPHWWRTRTDPFEQTWSTEVRTKTWTTVGGSSCIHTRIGSEL